jgi:polyhydroxyalkanoate synthase
VTQNAPDFLTQAAQQFQQSMTENWSKAVQSLQSMDLGALGSAIPASGAKKPEIHFAPEKLQELQQQYLSDAMGLFSQGLSAPTGDKRFSGEAWGSNPVAAY